MDSFLPIEVITSKILLIRKQRVMLDRDLAALYGVGTKVLNQAVKRNLNRFPADFMFQLLQVEKEQLVTNCDRFRSLKHSSSLPYAFTEQGVAMLSSVKQTRPAFISLALLGLLLLLGSLFIFRLEMLNIARKENALLRIQIQKEVARFNAYPSK